MLALYGGILVLHGGIGLLGQLTSACIMNFKKCFLKSNLIINKLILFKVTFLTTVKSFKSSWAITFLMSSS